MFDGLSGLDWLFIVAALALGFGVVKFMLVAKPGQHAAVPSVLPEAAASEVDRAGWGGQSLEATEQASADGRREPSGVEVSPVDQLPGIDAVDAKERPAWHELLGIPRTASAKEIEHAFTQNWSSFAPGKYTRLMADLSFIADGGLDEAMPKQLELRSLKLAVTAQQLQSMLGRLLHDMEAARDEGLMRRRQGLMD